MSQKNRLCIVGAQCGKTSICWRLLHPEEEFINIEDPTIQSYFSIPFNKLLGDGIDRFKGENLTIMDTSGSNSYYELYDEWFSWGQIFVLVYSIGDVNSFDAIPLFTDRVFKATKSKNVPLILIGTKTDLPAEERKVLEIEGRSLAYRYKCPFIEVSAKTGHNVNEAFRLAADALYEFLTAPPPALEVPVDSKKSPGKKSPGLQRKRSQSSISPKLKSKSVTKTSSSNSGEFDGMISPRGAEQSPPLSPTPQRDQYDMSGILQLKGKKKFVTLKDSIVTFYKSEKDATSPSAKKESVMLMTSTVKPDMDKSSCKFQLINPQNTYNLKAPDVTTMDQWIKAMQDGILSALNDVKSVKELKAEANQSSGPTSDTFVVENLTGQKALDLFHTSPESKRCADCQNDYADWASINLGIVICIQCSGVHRSLGVQTSKVRSITLDDWDSFLIDMMKAIGNVKSNAVWEANTDNVKFPRPSATALRDEKERFIRAKYLSKQFMKKETKSAQELNEEAVQVVKKGASGLARLVDLVAHGVDVNMPLEQETQRPNSQLTGNYLSLLHVAASVPDNCLIIEYLIKNNAEVNRIDANGATPLDWAAKSQPAKEKSREFKLLQLRGGTLTSATTNTNENTSVPSTPRAVNINPNVEVTELPPMSSTVGPVLNDKPPTNLPPMVARKTTVSQPGIVKTASFPAPPTSAQLSPRPPTQVNGSGPASANVVSSGTTPPPSPKGPQSIQVNLNRSMPSNPVIRTVSSPRTPPPVPPPPSPRDQSGQPKTGAPSSPRDQPGPSPPTSPRKGSLAASMPPNPRPPSGIVAQQGADSPNGSANGPAAPVSTPPIAIRGGLAKSGFQNSDAVGSKSSSPLSLSLEKISATPAKQPGVGSPTSLGFRPAPPRTPPPSVPTSPTSVSNPPSPLPRGGSAPNLVNSAPKGVPKVPPRVTFKEPPK